MVPYYKLLSTILSQGKRVMGWGEESILALYNQTIELNVKKSFPIAPNVDFDLVIKDYTSVKNRKPIILQQSTLSWEPGMPLVIRDAMIFLRSQRRASFSFWVPQKGNKFGMHPEVLTVHLVRKGHVLNASVLLSAVDVLNILPYRIASLALIMQIICRYQGYSQGKLTVMIGEAYISNRDRIRAKEFLINPVDRQAKKLSIKPRWPSKGTDFELKGT